MEQQKQSQLRHDFKFGLIVCLDICIILLGLQIAFPYKKYNRIISYPISYKYIGLLLAIILIISLTFDLVKHYGLLSKK